MADRARFYVEQSIPEIKDLEEKKVFTKEELRTIVKKRVEFENALARRQPMKGDFLRYIEYEQNMEALRRLRVKRKNIKGKPGPSDHGGRRRILFLYKRATSRFHGDIDLWEQNIAYAQRERSTKALSGIFAGAIQHHPTKALFWVHASRYEADVNGNMTAARALMQRGLRLCTLDKTLWIEYFTLEMDFVAKLVARRKVLGIAGTETKPIEDEKKEADFDGDDDETSGTIRLPDTLMDGEEKRELTATDSARIEAFEMILKGAIPQAIVKSITEKFSGAVDVYEGLLRVCSRLYEYEFAWDVQKTVLEAAASHGVSSAYIMHTTLASPLLRGLSGQELSDALEAYVRAINDSAQASPEEQAALLDLAIETLDQVESQVNVKPVLQAVLLSMFGRAEQLGYLNGARVTSWMAILRDIGKQDAADSVLERAQLRGIADVRT